MKIIISDFDRFCRHSEYIKVTNGRIDIESTTFKSEEKKMREKKTSNQHCKKVKEAKKKYRTKKGRIKEGRANGNQTYRTVEIISIRAPSHLALSI